MGGLQSYVVVHKGVVYGRAYSKVGRVLASCFTLRLVWGVEFDHWCGDQSLKRTFPELF